MGVIGRLTDWVIGTATKTKDGVSEFLSHPINTTRQKIGDLLSGTVNVVKGTPEFIAQTTRNAVEAVLNLAQGVVIDTPSALVGGLLNTAVDTVRAPFGRLFKG